nr:PREDICTED: hormone-sensitive lipase [Latimeria chalumnae]|eukprot:XP_014345780.1 PREDICTED: hormone-sensitive lipase [Latimeria chalumnae]
MASEERRGNGNSIIQDSNTESEAAWSSLEENMDARTMFQVLHTLAEDNITFFRENSSETGRRFMAAFAKIQEHARSLEPIVHCFSRIYHIFDFDAQTPANGYRSLMKVVRSCVLYIIHKSRYVAANRRSIFFRASHNCAEIEAYCTALTQLRALVYFAQRLLTANRHGNLFFEEDRGLSEEFVKEYTTMHKGCFYGRCLGFQFTPAIRPFLQTISIGLVSFGENYRRHESGIGVAASSFFTSGKYAIDPELRGAEFERITQNLDVHFWKAFWNITEMEVLTSLVNITSSTVRVNKVLSVPPNSFDLPLATDPNLMVTITPPVAHTGPAPVQMRLLSYELREGQDSEELNSLVKLEGPLNLDLRLKTKKAPRSKCLIVHFHGGGFVAQTSKSHEPYLKSWAHELDIPILSVDYSLAPEAPFPRALEECFFAYCWAIKNCHLLGSTGERICLAGESAGGNLCITVSIRAAAYGIKMPHGIMAAYPATLLQAAASPSRLLTLIDPLLPLSVLSKCVSAYAGTEPAHSEQKKMEQLNTVSVVRRDTALLLRDIRLGASAWLNSLLDAGRIRNNTDPVRKSVSEAALNEDSLQRSHNVIKSQTFQNLENHKSGEQTLLSPTDRMVAEEALSTLSGQVTQEDKLISHSEPVTRVSSPIAHAGHCNQKKVTVSHSNKGAPETILNSRAQDKGLHHQAKPWASESEEVTSWDSVQESEVTVKATPRPEVKFFLNKDEAEEAWSEAGSDVRARSPAGVEGVSENSLSLDFPGGFEPLRSDQGVSNLKFQLSPIVKNPFMSPLLAPDEMLRGLPPVHIVVSFQLCTGLETPVSFFSFLIAIFIEISRSKSYSSSTNSVTANYE